MTQPIDIPVKRSRLQAATLERSIFPPDEGPYFGYIELFGSGDVYRALSSGSGKYVEIGPRCSLPTLSFIVEKDRFSKRITVEITSLGLQQAVGYAIQQQPTSFAPLELGFNTILSKYEALKTHLAHLREKYPYDDVTAEMQLLVESLLLERALYDGMNMDALRQRQILCAVHLQDIHARNVSNGLNEIEDCFELGLVPDHDTERYLEALNLRYADLARSGNYAELRNLCEPITRSGEIELQYDQALLLEVLNNGYLDVYQYMLDLMDRTKKPNPEIQDSQYPDVTYEPMYVAIRLGQVEAVRRLIGDEQATFEGYVQDDDQGPIDKDRIFTPLYAATYWHQPEIARLLLDVGPVSVYTAEMPQAIVLAQQNGLMDMLHLFMEYPQPSTPATFLYDILPQPPSAQFQFTVSPQNLQLPIAPSSSPPGSVQSVSGITNALSGFDSNNGFQPASFTSTSTLGPSTQPQPLMPLEFSTMPAASLLAELEFGNTYPTANAVFERPTQPHVSFIRHTSTYKARQQLGRSLLRRLEGRCNKLRALCRHHPTSDVYSEVAKCFSTAKAIWKPGIDCFREITRNKAPSSLVEVLLLLSVADALGCHITHAGEDLEPEFTNDLGRWRTLLQGQERSMFDEIVCAVWDIESIPILDIPENDTFELYRFQELIQNLISFEEMRPIKTRSSGSRLQAVQQQLKKRKCKTGCMGRAIRPPIQPAGSFQSIGSVLGRLTHDTDEFHEDELDLGEFIDLGALGGELLEPEVAQAQQVTEPATGWKDVQPIVVFVLASFAFSIVLTAVSVIQDGPEERRPKPFSRATQGYGRSCAIVEGFLSFQRDNFYDSGIDVQSASEEGSSPYIREMKKASQRNSRIRSLDPAGGKSSRLTAAASMSSPSGSSFMSTDFSSPDTARTKERRAKCASCHKTFSSISNRNKHMREGCSKIERMGYKCGNEQCKKVLTTKWYRDRHEQTRCRFR